MKTTMLMRPIANPRRTTLANLKDLEEPDRTPEADEAPDPAALVPRQTANPRRTVVDKLPTA